MFNCGKFTESNFGAVRYIPWTYFLECVVRNANKQVVADYTVSHPRRSLNIYYRRDSSAGIVTRWWDWSLNPGWVKGPFCSPNRPASCWMGTGFLYRGGKAAGAHLHLAVWLRISGGTPLLSLHVFVAWTDIILYRRYFGYETLKLCCHFGAVFMCYYCLRYCLWLVYCAC